ncbi:MAG: hypothetical protein AAF937_08395 [Planctomycetota bacterium]
MAISRNRLKMFLAVAITGTSAAQDASPLSGPSVKPESTAPTLIERDYEGRLRPLDQRPEVAAIGLLGLADDDLADAREVIARRGARVEQLAYSNLLLLGEVGTALAAAPPEAGLDAVDADLRQRFNAAMGELWKGTPLVDQIEQSLPEPARGGYRTIVNDWYAAAMDEARPRAVAAGVGSFELVIRDVIGSEVERAVARGQAGRDQAYEEFLAALDLDPEVEGEVRRVALDAYLRILNDTGREPDKAGEARIFREMLAVIPQEDHPRVWRAVLRMGMDEPGED